MEREEVHIRAAKPEDAERLLAIYAPYVEKTAVTFEYDVPSAEEFRGRIVSVLARFPYLAAEKDGEIVGYAYAGPFHSRAAYGWGVETSIYVDPAKKRMGLGGKLHRALENVLREQGFLNMNACIAVPEKDDEYLTRNSVEFHRHLGYRMVGEFSQAGYKFGRWYNMAWMEKHIGPHGPEAKPPVGFAEVRERVKEKYHIG